MKHHNIHFVGSIGLDDAETVFRSLSQTIGELAKRYPDGETGVRTNWVMWQGSVFAGHPEFEFVQAGEVNRPEKYRLRRGSNPERLEFPALGYADEALTSYALFAELRDAGVIPSGVRFQVSLPTPLAVVVGFSIAEDCPKVEPAYDQAMQRELSAILTGIPHRDLALQWDICIEVVACEGALPIYVADPQQHAENNVSRLTGLIPEAVDVGIHLCYGDPNHKHIVEPADLATSVRFANAIAQAAPRRLDWVHMAVPRDRDDNDYFAPLRGLETEGAELALGLVHYTDGLQGTKRRMAAARSVVNDFGIATECGFGRRPEDTIPMLLRMHAEAATVNDQRAT